MNKFRHLLTKVETLIGHGPVGPGEIINTDLDLSSSPNFEAVVDEPAPVEEVVVDTKSKKSAPVIDPPAPAPEVEA